MHSAEYAIKNKKQQKKRTRVFSSGSLVAGIRSALVSPLLGFFNAEKESADIFYED
jgi:hypothetical protein